MAGPDPSPEAESLIGIVGADTSEVEGLQRVAADLGSQLASGDPEGLLRREPSILLAVGAEALSAIARCDAIDRLQRVPPVVPVGRVDGVSSVPRGRVRSALRAVSAGERTERAYRTLAVTVDDPGDGIADGTATNGFFDVTLDTEKPARISEYAVRTPSGTVDRFRADGVVVATAAGSHGYASAADGPTLADAIDAVVVVPIAPFVTDRDQWVLPPAGLSLTVERDETVVSLQVDERVIGSVAAGTTVHIEPGPSFSILTTGESRGPFD